MHPKLTFGGVGSATDADISAPNAISPDDGGRPMASVFLSYDHDDEKRARPIVSAVEEAGHLVWWDQRMHGGSEYNTEIETAVERADAVVVLWSKTSVRSPWV